MRILFSILFALTTLASYSQVLSYNDLGILFSRDNNRGSARFNALSGAFGALGGDISATDINPAGAAIAKKSSLSVTLNNQNNNYEANYYGNSFNHKNSKTNISQVGGLLSFDSAFKSKWNRFAMFFNYSLKNNFSRSYDVEGYSFPLYEEHFSDNSTTGQFDRNLYQLVSSDVNIRTGVANIGFSSAYENKLLVGASLKVYNLEFSEITFYNEENDDIDGNILNVEDLNETFIQGNGIGFSLGLIYKLNKNIRFGLSYETPTWYQEVIEDYFNELYMSRIVDLGIESFLENNENSFVYRYKTPSKTTVSGAYIFEKKGLISIDFTHRDYTNISFSDADFRTENENFNTNYRDTYSLKIGTEWRIDRISIRGGASYEKGPNLIIGGNVNDDNIKSFSLGFGYNFGNSQFDLSYNNYENTEFQSIINTGDLSINNRTSQVSGTLTFNL